MVDGGWWMVGARTGNGRVRKWPGKVNQVNGLAEGKEKGDGGWDGMEIAPIPFARARSMRSMRSIPPD
jgi:hypothetical protein